MSRESDPTARDWASRTHPIEENMALQRATWRLQRVGWAVLALLVLASLLGVFANGVLSSTAATGADGRIEVRYGRFERAGASTRMEIRLRAGDGGDTMVRLGPSFIDAFTIGGVHPQPVEERSGPDGAELSFRATAGAPIRIYLDLRPEKVGLVRSEVAVAGGSPARLVQFIYP